MNIPEGWPTQEMCRGLIDFCNVHLDLSPSTWETRQMILSALAAAPTPPAQEASLPPDVINALRFYANGDHFTIDSDAQEFDTVSGEPVNWLWSQRDEDGTAIEDGSIARAVLQGKKIHGDAESQPVEGEVFHSTPAPVVEPVAWMMPHVIPSGPYKGEIAWAPSVFCDSQKQPRIDKDSRRYYPYPLYTHPSDDGLRKAASEFNLNTLRSVSNWFLARAETVWAKKGGHDFLMKEWAKDLENLRAELNKDKS